MSNISCPADRLQLTQVDQDQHPVAAHSHGVLVTWLFFNIASSQFFLPILMAALSFAKPRAESTLINLVITWIISGLVSSVLLYSGHAEGCEPPPLLCLSQGSLYIAVPSMTTVALFGAVLQVFFNVRQKVHQSLEPKDHSVRRICLLVAPYVTYAIFATVTAASGASTFETTVSRTRRFFLLFSQI